uniref:Uncharacterized protein n=1 Tax=Eutreptiella gymnastica TaxID=73025 RepID=A0A7S1I3M3_9EUGL
MCLGVPALGVFRMQKANNCGATALDPLRTCSSPTMDPLQSRSEPTPDHFGSAPHTLLTPPTPNPLWTRFKPLWICSGPAPDPFQSNSKLAVAPVLRVFAIL